MLFSPTIGAAISARFWYLRVRCLACRSTSSIDLRMLDHRRDAAVTSLHPCALMPFMPAERAIRRAGAAVTDKYR